MRWAIFKVLIKSFITRLLFSLLVYGWTACGILAPQPGIEPSTSELETENHPVVSNSPRPHGLPSGWSSQGSPRTRGSDPGLPQSLPAELQGKPSELEGALVSTGPPRETPEHGF